MKKNKEYKKKPEIQNNKVEWEVRKKLRGSAFWDGDVISEF